MEKKMHLSNQGMHKHCQILLRVHCGEPRLVYNVVLKMVDGLGNVGHFVVMDNFFSSIWLFMDLLAMGIYASGTIRPNRVGLPSDLKDMKSFKMCPKAIHYGECMIPAKWRVLCGKIRSPCFIFLRMFCLFKLLTNF